MSLREQIFSISDYKTETVDIPEWGISVSVRSLTARERAQYESKVYNGGKIDLQWAYALLATLGTVDEQGTRVFADDDLEAVSAKNAAAIERIAKVVSRLSGLGTSVEEAAKN